LAFLDLEVNLMPIFGKISVKHVFVHLSFLAFWSFLNPDQSTIFHIKHVKHKITLNLSTGLVKNRQGI
jgi:hypothetical protein